MFRKENYSDYELEKLLYNYETGQLVDTDRITEDSENNYIGIDLTNINPLEIIIVLSGAIFLVKKFCPGTWLSFIGFIKYLF